MEREYIRPVDGLPGAAGSSWLASDAPDYPQIGHDARFDVAIVGGGLVGALAALHLWRLGARVAVIDRRRVGAGVSGHSTAKITAQHQLGWSSLLELHDADRLLPYAERNAEAPARIEAIVQERRLDCGFARTPSYVYARSSAEAQGLESEAGAYEALKLPGGLRPSAGAPFAVEAQLLAMPDQAQFDPAAFVTGLLGGLGPAVTVAEQTAVRRVEEGDGAVLLHCDGVVVRAGSAIMASHVPVLDTAGYFARVFPYRSYALEMHTAAEFEYASWIAAGSNPGLTLRPVGEPGEGRWIVSGVAHKAGQGGDERACYAELAARTLAEFPDATFTHHWSTQDGITADGLPFVGRVPRTDRVFMATGFGGWGMTKSVLAAELLADLVDCGASLLSELLDPGRADPLKNMGEFISENVDAGAHLVKGLLFGSESEKLEVAEHEAGSTAVRHTPSGTSDGHDAHCTHMGCVVEVNEAELTWDCPCHGSRFAADAAVIEGPARTDLRARSLDDQRPTGDSPGFTARSESPPSPREHSDSDMKTPYIPLKEDSR